MKTLTLLLPLIQDIRHLCVLIKNRHFSSRGGDLTCIIDQYIYPTPYFDSFLYFAFDNIEASRHIEL